MNSNVNPPREYDLSDPLERRRLMREVRGYLQTCHYKHGTDWEGRKFAMDALDKIIADGGTLTVFFALRSEK